MNIERLNKAATAAGYAMATDVEETIVAVAKTEEPSQSRAVAVLQARAGREAYIATARDWFKSYLPALGWRAPA